jgi:hypothetical protein
MRIDSEDVDQFERREDIRRGEDALRNQRRIPGVPITSGQLPRDVRESRIEKFRLCLKSQSLHAEKRKLSHLQVGDKSQRKSAQVQRVCDKVQYIPQIVAVFVQTTVPQLLNLHPYQT